VEDLCNILTNCKIKAPGSIIINPSIDFPAFHYISNEIKTSVTQLPLDFKWPGAEEAVLINFFKKTLQQLKNVTQYSY